MRNTIYRIVFVLAATLAITSCTEEEIAPSNTSSNGGGGGQTGCIGC